MRDGREKEGYRQREAREGEERGIKRIGEKE